MAKQQAQQFVEENVGVAKQQAQESVAGKIGDAQQQTEQVVQQVQSQVAVAVDQAAAQVELVRQEAARLLEEGMASKQFEAETLFAERMRETAVQMAKMESNFQTQIKDMHEQMKSDYDLHMGKK